jgi:hypothetical protein
MVDRVRLAELTTEVGGREVIAEDLPAAHGRPRRAATSTVTC